MVHSRLDLHRAKIASDVDMAALRELDQCPALAFLEGVVETRPPATTRHQPPGAMSALSDA